MEITPEKRKKLDRLGYKFLFVSIVNIVHHVLMLIVLNFICTFGVLIMEWPEWMMYVCSTGATIFVFRRMISITKESRDRLIQDSKKIIES